MKKTTRTKLAHRPPEIKYGHERLILAVLVLMMIVLSLLSKHFFTFDNLTATTRNIVEPGLIALGMTFVILMADIDLSVGSLAALCTIMMSKVHELTGSTALALLTIFAVGLIGGFINGIFVGYLKIPAFIGTMATMFVYQGLALGISKGVTISSFPKELQFLAYGTVLGFPFQFVLFIVMAIIFAVVLHFTSYGRYIRTIGFNPRCAASTGIDVPKIKLITFMISGLMCSLAALVLLARVSTAKATLGAGYDMTSITAVVLGGTAITGGYGSIKGTVMGLLIIGLLKNGFTLARFPSEIATITIGALLLMSIILSVNAKSLEILFHGGKRK
ncbi:MAG: ABC transporter permease [Erysipelotrichaceae bacterium]|nr:ABC transporter permease [Erysipelotrichaceae bacterium]